MFQRNSVLQLIFVRAVVAPKSGHLWGRQNGLLRKQTGGRLSAHRWVTGSKYANHTTGYIRAKLNGLKNAHLNRSLRAAVTRKSADALTMMPLIANVAGFCKSSGVGQRAFFLKDNRR